MLGGPLCVGSPGGLVEFVGGAVEHEAYVDVRVGLLDA